MTLVELLHLVAHSLTSLLLNEWYLLFSVKLSSLSHWSFIFDSLVELREECRNLGQTLIVRRGAAASVFEELVHEFPIGAIHAHEETGNGWSRARDESVRDWCAYHSVDFYEYPSNGIIRGLANRDDWARLRGARMLMPTVPSPSNLIGLPNINDHH